MRVESVEELNEILDLEGSSYVISELDSLDMPTPDLCHLHRAAQLAYNTFFDALEKHV